MKKSKIIEFARKNGYDTVSSLGKWRGYDAYEPIMKGATEEEPAFTGPPLMILVKGDEIRMSTPDEAYEQMESAADEDVEKFNPYHDSRGRFTSANSATSFTWKPGQGAVYDNAIAREKERHAAGGGGGTASEDTPRMKTIHGIEDNIRNQFYESAAVVDKDGNVVFQKSGAANAVGFTKMECFMMRNNTLTHNHPGSSMFSTEDIVCFTQNNMEEIRATTREGTTYSIKRGKDYTQERAWQFVAQYDGERKIAHRIAQRELDQRGFRGKIMDGEITQEYANREFGKVVTREMTTYCNKYASQYGLEYSVEKRAVDNEYNLEVFTGKSAGGGDMILDEETNALDDAAFNEWLNQTPEEPGPAEKSFSVLKTDEDKRLVFGWASISITVAGEQLEDRQEDIIDPEDLEEAAYEYVLEFRDTGEEHIPSMRKKGKLVESCVLTAEKQKAMGIPEGTVPVGWWIGFKIEDDAAWDRVKNGTYKMFSIEGKANRIPVVKAQRNYDEFPSYSMWLEENLDATIEEQREAKEYFRKKKPVAKSFDEILKTK